MGGHVEALLDRPGVGELHVPGRLEMQGLHRLTAQDRARDVRTHDRAAVDECRVRDGELERRHLEIALADRQVDRLPLVPRLMLRGAEPGRGRDEPFLLGSDVNAGRSAEAHDVRPPLQWRVRALVEAKTDLVEVGVAGGGERRRQRHRLVRERITVGEGLAVDDLLASALEDLVGQAAGRPRPQRVDRFDHREAQGEGQPDRRGFWHGFRVAAAEREAQPSDQGDVARLQTAYRHRAWS